MSRANVMEPAGPDTATPDPRLLRIPRSPVLGAHTLGHTEPATWPRLDRQGPSCLTTSGRVAILLALRTLGVGAGDSVLVPTYHCPTMIEPVVRLGAKPVFYAIGRLGEVDIDSLGRSVSAKPKALLAAHFFGLPQHFGPVRQFCEERGISFIEDCAHAFFGYSPSGPVGSIGDISIGSLPKFFPVVEGGCLVMRSHPDRLPALMSQGVARELHVAWDALELGAAAGRLGWINAGVSALAQWKNRLRGRRAEPGPAGVTEPDIASACNTIVMSRVDLRATSVAHWLVRHAAVERIATTRRANYRAFARLLGGNPRFRPLRPELPAGAVPYVFPLEVDEPRALYRALRIRGIPLYRWDIVWPGTPVLPNDAGSRWWNHVFQLPCHEDMTDEDIEAVAGAIEAEAGGPAA